MKFTSDDKICNIDDFKEERYPRISITALSKVLPLRELKRQKTRMDFLISSLTTFMRKAILRVFFLHDLRTWQDFSSAFLKQ